MNYIKGYDKGAVDALLSFMPRVMRQRCYDYLVGVLPNPLEDCDKVMNHSNEVCEGLNYNPVDDTIRFKRSKRILITIGSIQVWSETDDYIVDSVPLSIWRGWVNRTYPDMDVKQKELDKINN